MLSFTDYLAHLDADSHLLAAAASRGLDPLAPCCPGWNVRDVIVHTAEVQSHKADLVAGGWVDTSPPRPHLPEGADAVEWFRREASRLYEALSDADPAAPANTFGPDKTVGFWIRRMAHETLIHRVDAELAHGYESAVDLELAGDGVAELFEVFITGHPKWARFQPGDAVIRVDTAEQSWTVRLGRFIGNRDARDYVVPTTMLAPEDEPDAVVSGDPDRVLLWMWGRAPLDDVAVAGELAVATRFREICALRETSGTR